MASLEETQRRIAVSISGLSPEMQRVCIEVCMMSFKAGYQQAQNDFQSASQSLLVH